MRVKPDDGMGCEEYQSSCNDEIPSEANFIDKDTERPAEECGGKIGDGDYFSSGSSGKAKPLLKEKIGII